MKYILKFFKLFTKNKKKEIKPQEEYIIKSTTWIRVK